MTLEWPIADAEQASFPVRGCGAARLAAVRRDLFLEPALRLSEQERALVEASLRDLVSTMANELGAALGGDLGGDGEPLFALLGGAGLLDRPALVAALLSAADEQRIGAALRGRLAPDGAREAGLAAEHVGHEDPAIAGAAMELVAATARRRDRFGRTRLDPADLPRHEAAALADIVGAGIVHLYGAHDPALEQRLAAGIAALLARIEATPSHGTLVERLVDGFVAAGQLDDALLMQALARGEVRLVAALLARRASLDTAAAFEILVTGGAGERAGLLRLAAVGRPAAAKLLAEIDGPLVGASSIVELGWFDRLGDDTLARLRGDWRLPPGLRAARDRLAGAERRA